MSHSVVAQAPVGTSRRRFRIASKRAPKTDAEPSFFLDLGAWTVERWHQREPPARESILLLKGLEDGNGPHQLDFIQLLSCLDPSSDDACDLERRQRKLHSWGTAASA